MLKLWPPSEAGFVISKELAQERLVRRSPCQSVAASSDGHAAMGLREVLKAERCGADREYVCSREI